MAGSKKPGEPGKPSPETAHRPDGGNRDDLERRSRELNEALATKLPASRGADEGGRSGSGNLTGFGQAIKLSSEFVAAIAVGAGLGWLIDKVAGTSPWGLIVFLLLGFAAGVLNVLRSAGLVAEPKGGTSRSGPGRRDDK